MGTMASTLNQGTVKTAKGIKIMVMETGMAMVMETGMETGMVAVEFPDLGVHTH